MRPPRRVFAPDDGARMSAWFAATSQSPVTPSSVAASLLAAKERNISAEAALRAHAARRLRLTSVGADGGQRGPVDGSPVLDTSGTGLAVEADAPPQLNAR